MKLIFISNRITRSDFKKALSLYGLDLEEMCRSGQLIVSDKEESLGCLEKKGLQKIQWWYH